MSSHLSPFFYGSLTHTYYITGFSGSLAYIWQTYRTSILYLILHLSLSLIPHCVCVCVCNTESVSYAQPWLIHSIILKLNYLIIDSTFVFFRKHKHFILLKCVYLSHLSVALRFFSSNCFRSPFDFPTGKGRENKSSSFVSLPNNWGFVWYFVKILGSFC